MERLAQRLARGEQAAYAELYDLCADRLYGYLWQKLGSQADAADLVQESFLRLVRSRRRLRQVDDPVAYLFAVARNESARHVARRSRQRAEPLPDGLGGCCCPDGPRPMRQTDALDSITHALRMLDPVQREVVELKIYGQLTLSQVAATLSVPPGTVATRYRTALDRMRQLLANEFP